MAVLSDVRILEKIYDKKFSISPFEYENIQPSSIDLTLDNKIKVPKKGITESINMFNPEIEKYFEEKTLESYSIEPGEFIIGQIKETIKLSNEINGQIHNRNSLIRMGINVGLSTYINPGYEGKLPIVIQNIGSFKIDLIPGMRICQLMLQDVEPIPERDYSQRHDAKYQGEKDISLSKLYLDREFIEYINHKAGSETGKIDKKNLMNFLNIRIEKAGKEIAESIEKKYKEGIGL